MSKKEEREYPELTPDMVEENNPYVSTLRASMTIVDAKKERGGYLYTLDAWLFESTPWELLLYPCQTDDDYHFFEAWMKFELTGPDGKIYRGSLLRSLDSGDFLPRYIEKQGRVRVFQTVNIGHFDDDGTAIVIIFTVEPKKEFVPGAHSAQILVWKKGFFDRKG